MFQKETSSWVCPHCNRPVTRTTEDISIQTMWLHAPNSDGRRVFSMASTVCPNAECKHFTFEVEMDDMVRVSSSQVAVGETLKTWRLIPPSKAKVFPDYTPQPIRDDYVEACLIVEASPKASATLSRRCLQGMIRDFYGVSKNRLVDEIEAIKDKSTRLLGEPLMPCVQSETSVLTWKRTLA